jgi:hypothetical protein
MCVAENKLVLDVLAERLMQSKDRTYDGQLGCALSMSSCLSYILTFVMPGLFLDFIVGTATAAFSDSTVYCYNSFLGLPVARDAVAYFLAKRFLFSPEMQVTPEAALYHIKAQHVAIGSGCAAVLHYLFFTLGEEGECCLIPAPYYAAFDSDMVRKSHVSIM